MKEESLKIVKGSLVIEVKNDLQHFSKKTSLNAGDTLEAISRTDYSVFSSSSDDSDAQDEEIHDPQLYVWYNW